MPYLEINYPECYVVDADSVEISGKAYYADSVTVNGEQAELGSTGYFSIFVPLDVGENEILVTAVGNDSAITSETFRMTRLVTDRTQEDVDYVKYLQGRQLPWAQWSDDEKEFWAGVVRGKYNTDDFNRVETAVERLSFDFKRMGYAPKPNPKTDWTVEDSPSFAQRASYLSDVEEIRRQLPVQAPDVPPDMETFNFGQANDIEQILVDVNRIMAMIPKSFIRCGAAGVRCDSRGLPTEQAILPRTWVELDELGWSWDEWDEKTWMQISYAI